MCNASKPLSGVVSRADSLYSAAGYDRRRCRYPHQAAADEGLSPELWKCPGAQHLTLCPEGFFCRTPIEIEKCPPGAFCPLGSSEPVACPWFGDCGKKRLGRPRYRESFGVMAWAAVFAIFAASASPRGYVSPTNRGDAAAATWICLLTNRGEAATWICLRRIAARPRRGYASDESRRRG